MIDFLKKYKYYILGGIFLLYLIGYAALYLYKERLMPQILSVSPKNHTRNVDVNTDIRIGFDREIILDKISIESSPAVSIEKLTRDNDGVLIRLASLEEKTIYTITLKYNGVKLAEWRFSTSGTPLLSYLGFPPKYSEELFDISVSTTALFVYIRFEPYEENKEIAIKYIEDKSLNPNNLPIYWYAPNINDDYSWEDLIGPSPDGAP